MFELGLGLGLRLTRLLRRLAPPATATSASVDAHDEGHALLDPLSSSLGRLVHPFRSTVFFDDASPRELRRRSPKVVALPAESQSLGLDVVALLQALVVLTLLPAFGHAFDPLAGGVLAASKGVSRGDNESERGRRTTPC